MAHEERNDALKRNAKIPLARYEFADRVLPKHILVGDIGCGTGYGRTILENGGRKVIGMDKPCAIKQARIDYPGEYLEIDLDDKDIISYEFDSVVCLETLLHLKEPEKFLSKLECEYLVISAPIDTDPNDGYIYRLHNVSEDQFKKMLIGKWVVKDEMWQRCGEKENYLVIYAKSSNNR